MNILFICDEYPPGKNGGIGTMVQVLSRELVKKGHGVFVIGLYAHSYLEKNYEEDNGVKVWRLRYGVNLHLNANHIAHKIFNKIPDFIKQHLNGRKAFDKFIDFINNLIDIERIDVIEIPDWNTFAMKIGFPVKWPSFNVPFIVKSNGSYTYFCDEMNEPPKEKLTLIDKELYKRADALSAVSLYTANKNKRLFDVKKEITILYNSIEIPQVEQTKKRDDKTVIFTGTLIAKKGIFQLMKAWNIVIAKQPEAKLIIYGKGNIDILKKILTPQSLTSVIFKGHVSRTELMNNLASATLAVFPSYSEAFALAVLEAMSVGCPVVYTIKSSGPEVIAHGINGELIDPDNVNEIADSIIRILDNNDLQTQYSENGKKTILNQFNINKSAQDHINYYTNVLTQFNTLKI